MNFTMLLRSLWMKWGKKNSTPAENWMPMVIDGHHYEYHMATNRIRADPPREYAAGDRERMTIRVDGIRNRNAIIVSDNLK